MSRVVLSFVSEKYCLLTKTACCDIMAILGLLRPELLILSIIAMSKNRSLCNFRGESFLKLAAQISPQSNAYTKEIIKNAGRTEDSQSRKGLDEILRS